MLAFGIVLGGALVLAGLTFFLVWRARGAPYAPAPALRVRASSPYRTPGRKQPARGF